MTSAISEDLLDALRKATPVRGGRPYLMPVPDCEPPYDDVPPPPAPLRPGVLKAAVVELDTRPVSAGSEPPWRLPVPAQSAAHPGPGAAVAHPAVPDHERDTIPGSAPAARSIAGAASRILIEALCGARPVRQLAGTCAAPVLTTLGRRVRVGGSIPRLMSVHVCEPAPRVAEVSAVYRDRDRVAALAFRLETVGDRWRVTQLQLG